MKIVKIYFLNTNDTQVDYRNSFFVSDSELESLNRFKHAETKEEKTASLYLKKKYIGDYSVDSHGKPLSEKTYFKTSRSLITFSKLLLINPVSLAKLDIVSLIYFIWHTPFVWYH